MTHQTFKGLDPVSKKTMELDLAIRVGFEEDHRHVDYDNRQKVAERQLRAFVSKGGMPNSVWLAGPSQSGKTSLLCCMLKQKFREWADQRESPFYVLPLAFSRSVVLITHQQFVSICYDEFKSDNREDLMYQQVAQAGLLLFDDLGTASESASGYNLSRLEQLIDDRSKALLPTWITSNLSAAALSKKKDWARIYGRLTKKKWMSYYQIIKGK